MFWFFAHDDQYAMLCKPDQPPEFDAEATIDWFQKVASRKQPFISKEGGGGDPKCEFVCGFLGCDARPFTPLLEGLPRLLRIRLSPRTPDTMLSRLIDLTLTDARLPPSRLPLESL